MKSFLFLLSQFTSEALLLESFLIFLCAGGYALFWLIKRRKWGIFGKSEVQLDPVRDYLDQVIGQTEDLRGLLFGGLTEPRTRTAKELTAKPAKVVAVDEAAVGNSAAMEDLEKQLAAQTLAVNKLTEEKQALENRLAEAQQSASAAPAADGSQELNDLKDKLAELEAKLEEYSIIEDDLSNLKRFQQENAQLKSLLAEKEIPLPDFTETPIGNKAKALKQANEAKAAAPTAEPEPKTEPLTPEPSTAEAKPPAPEPAKPEAPKAPPAEPATAPAGATAGATALPKSQPSTPPEDIPAAPKGAESEKELAAEFEKMFK